MTGPQATRIDNNWRAEMPNGQQQSILDSVNREAIRDVVNRYYDGIWRNDIDAVVGLFASDGTVKVTNGPMAVTPPVGYEELHRFYVAGVEKMTPRPFVHNHIVDLQGDDRATGRCYVELRSSIDYSWIAAVIYVDEYVKIDGTWKFQRREATQQNV
jgi:hypothetical protein